MLLHGLLKVGISDLAWLDANLKARRPQHCDEGRGIQVVGGEYTLRGTRDSCQRITWIYMIPIFVVLQVVNIWHVKVAKWTLNPKFSTIDKKKVNSRGITRICEYQSVRPEIFIVRMGLIGS